ncbi:uncharacterized protein HKW66_Vig0231840 [Vigna angularis]|uniref:Uncharacterized protein n=1 Tax=Phaseolus angularis TaxID=3914 RepID=A0A8T0KBV6_PHAAN|nr:uncharacterized protein HKW66_Vig0231840 [Vigna angularis]
MEKRRKKPYTFLEGEEEGGIGGVDDVADIENVMRWLLPGGGCSKVGVAPWLPRVEREGSEDFVRCNFFEWCSEEVIDSRNVVNVEDSSASARNEEVGRSLMKMEQSVMKMEERDVEKLKIGCLEKRMKVLMGMVFDTCICNVIVISMLMKLG